MAGLAGELKVKGPAKEWQVHAKRKRMRSIYTDRSMCARLSLAPRRISKRQRCAAYSERFATPAAHHTPHPASLELDFSFRGFLPHIAVQNFCIYIYTKCSDARHLLSTRLIEKVREKVRGRGAIYATASASALLLGRHCYC